MTEYTVRVDAEKTIWRLNYKLHREDGPAIEWADGKKEWFINGKYHRVDGPAFIASNGYKAWFINGEEYTEEEFLAKTQPVKELSVAQLEALLGYKIKVVK